jgi:hypothetical protein
VNLQSCGVDPAHTLHVDASPAIPGRVHLAEFVVVVVVDVIVAVIGVVVVGLASQVFE